MLQESFRELPPAHPALPWVWVSLHSHVLWAKAHLPLKLLWKVWRIDIGDR